MCHNRFPLKTSLILPLCEISLSSHNPTCDSLKQPTHMFDRWRALLPVSCGYFSPSSLCSFPFFLIPPPAAVILKSSSPFPSFPLSFHGYFLIWYWWILYLLCLNLPWVWDRWVCLHLLISLLLSSTPGQMLLFLTKVAPSPLLTMATFVFRIPAPETSEQAAYHTDFAWGDYSVRMISQQRPVTSAVKVLCRSIVFSGIRIVLLRNRTPKESITFFFWSSTIADSLQHPQGGPRSYPLNAYVKQR